MCPLLRRLALALALPVSREGGGVEGQERLTVTVRQPFDHGHRFEVTAGREVVWGVPHFARVWFAAGVESPKVERVPGGFRAMFIRPGTYRGAFAAYATADLCARWAKA